MITILGKLADLAPYCNRKGYNVYTGDWTPELGRAWIVERVAAGDEFQCVSTDFTDNYLLEIQWLQNEEYKLRAAASVLIDRARELGKAVADVSKLALAEQRGAGT